MNRVNVPEFEDFHWFPAWIRNCMTNLIVVLQKAMGVPEAIAGLIVDLRSKTAFDQIVDMGSGSGGPMPLVIEQLQKEKTAGDLKLLMTDLHPNPQFIKKITRLGNPEISYSETPLDATHLESTPRGLKTMMNSFHHMSPSMAKKILSSAKEHHQPILIYEMGENLMPFWLWLLLLPIALPIMIIMVWFMTPMVRPMTWYQLIFTYLIPIIPLFYAWDGQASAPRMYSFKDMDVLLTGLEGRDYIWEKGHALKANGKKVGIFLRGYPIASSN